MTNGKDVTPTPGTTVVEGSSEAPFIYIDGYHGAITGGGSVRLRLTRVRLDDDPDGGGHNEAVAYLTMGVGTLISFHEALGQLIDTLKEQGDLTKISPSE